jgi:hypothetical protein
MTDTGAASARSRPLPWGSLDDVDEDDVGETRLGDPLGSGGADIAGSDDGDLVAGHGSGGSFGRSTLERHSSAAVATGDRSRPSSVR